MGELILQVTHNIERLVTEGHDIFQSVLLDNFLKVMFIINIKILFESNLIIYISFMCVFEKYALL